ncbi:MAG: AAA family ATPase [Chloroflexota bacterium]|nr:AAA family ATPase [Chloroflexota bacterium]
MALLERQREVDQVVDFLDAAQRGRGAVAVVYGPAGIGKTSLLTAARRLAAERGVDCLHARGGELERDFPFGVVRQLLEAPLRAMPSRRRAALLGGEAALAMRVLGLAADAKASAAVEPEDPLFGALCGLYRLSANLSQRGPLLVAVDDLHWADPSSLRFLGYLSRRVVELPVLVLMASRPAPSGAAAELIDAVGRDALVHRIEPAPLTETAVVELLADVLAYPVEGEFGRACHAATGGNPFLIAVLAAALSDARVVPVADQAERVADVAAGAVSRAVVERLGRLSPAAAALAGAVAVLGTDVEFRHAALLAELGERDAASAADALAEQGILRAGPRLSFVHPLVQAAVREQLADTERALAHRRAARLLDSEGLSPKRIAVHLLAAPPAAEPWVVTTLREAALRALVLGDAMVALAYLRRALQEPPSSEQRPAVLSDLGLAETRTGAPGAAEHLSEAIAIAADPETRVAATLRMSNLLKFIAQADRAAEVVQEQIDVLENASRLRDRLEIDLIGTAYVSRRARARLSDRINRLKDPGGVPAGELELLEVSALAFNAAIDEGDPDRAEQLARRAVSSDILTSDVLANAQALLMAVVALFVAERHEEAEQVCTRSLTIARTEGSVIAVASLSSMRSFVRYCRGELTGAEADAAAALELMPGSETLTPPAIAAALLTALERTQVPDGLEPLLTRARGVDPELLPHSLVLMAEGSVLAMKGDHEAALDRFLACDRREPGWGRDCPVLLPWRSSAGLALVQRGERDKARGLVCDELELARSFDRPRALGIALRAAGLIEGGTPGIELLREAVVTLATADARLEHARALTDLGAALRRVTRRSEARAPLRRGADLAIRCGATVLAERARTELAATGARPRLLVLTGADSLTASERRVTQMAAHGMSNREIAQALFVTAKTVETHLSRSYQKLGIKSRRELPR